MSGVGRYPDFLCIGAQKAGTTWLDKQLRMHRGVWLPPTKEVHYFDVVHLGRPKDAAGFTEMDHIVIGRVAAHMRAMLARGLPVAVEYKRRQMLEHIASRNLDDEWYREVFREAPESTVRGEITPAYALLPEAGIAHITRLQPGVKILFLLRDPIDRSWSQIRMEAHLRAGSVEAIADSVIEESDFVRRNDYVATIERYRKHIPAANMFVGYFDDIVERPEQMLRDVCTVLGIQFSSFRTTRAGEVINRGKPTPIPDDIYAKLRERLAPAYEKLAALCSHHVENWCATHYGGGAMALAPSRSVKDAAA